jgi:hypothetical protein
VGCRTCGGMAAAKPFSASREYNYCRIFGSWVAEIRQRAGCPDKGGLCIYDRRVLISGRVVVLRLFAIGRSLGREVLVLCLISRKTQSNKECEAVNACSLGEC